jgi:hypothetical protein
LLRGCRLCFATPGILCAPGFLASIVVSLQVWS